MAPAFFHEAEKTVCVMDAGGRVGAALVKKLLRRGYTVHAATQGSPRSLSLSRFSFSHYLQTVEELR